MQCTGTAAISGSVSQNSAHIFYNIKSDCKNLPCLGFSLGILRFDQ